MEEAVAQPLLGLVASALVIVLSLVYLSLFDFGTFVGWVAFVMLCLIPPQIVTVVLAPNPPYAARLRQPGRGLAVLIATFVAAFVIAPIVLRIAGEGVTPPGPIPSHFAVIVVPTTFFLAIIFGGWPYTKVTRNAGAVAAFTLVTAYVLTYVVFRLFFNYDFLQGAPVYLASAPQGTYNGVMAMVFYVTALAGMFLMLHFDLWPLTAAPAVMKQPVLGVVWLIIALAIGAVVMWITTGRLAMDPMYVLTRVTAPFIFGTIIVLNMLQNSLFAKLAQPLKGICNAIAAAAIGAALAQLYGFVSPMIVGPLPSGAPGYEYDIWLVNALLSVTFPFLIFYAAYFHYWPLAKPAAAATEPAHA
jgi:hypothetical protein